MGYAGKAALAALAAALLGCGGGTPAPPAQAPRLLAQAATGLPASAYHGMVQQLYIAYFGRPADPQGLANFAARLSALGAPADINLLDASYGVDPAVRELVDSFGSSAESNALYRGAVADFIEAIYLNVLGRAANADGKAFWSAAVQSGELSRARAALSILAGAARNTSSQGLQDAALIARRSRAAAIFTQAIVSPDQLNAYSGDAAAASARSMLAAIGSASSDAELQAAALAALAQLVAQWSASHPAVPGVLAACPTGQVTEFFHTSPIALADFLAFRPLGMLAPPIHMFPAKHSAFSMTPIGAVPVARPVLAPGPVFVTEIYEASFGSGSRNYQVFLRPCNEVRAYFGHLATISDKLRAEFALQAASCNSFNEGSTTVTTCRRENLAIALAEGEQFGTGPDSAGIDFGILDFRRAPAAFVDLSHYDAYYPYYTSPLDYFDAATRAAIAARTGSLFGETVRTALPVGGTYMQDVAGSAKGNWFLPGRYINNTTDLSPFLGLAHDFVDPSQPIISMGTSVAGMAMGQYAFAVQASGQVNREFTAVQPDGKVYCYDSFLAGRTPGSMPLTQASGALQMTMPDALSLKLAFTAAATCASAAAAPFPATATTFVR